MHGGLECSGNCMGDTWHGVLGMLCHVACHGLKASPPPLTPSIPTLAPHLAPPCEAIPAPTNHMPWAIGAP